jgi:uncharacterized membrane protein YfcA
VVLSDTPLILAVTGLLTGALVGLSGMGGGALLTPLLVLGAGVPPATAVSSDVLLSLLIKPFGASMHARHGTVRTDLVRWLALGSVPAAFAGAMAFNVLDLEDAAETLQALIGCALLLAAGSQTLRLRLRSEPGGGQPVARPLPTVAIGVLGGLLVGVTSVGSGSLMLVLLAITYPALSANSLVGTDLAQAIPLVASASLGHLLFGAPSFGLVGWLLAGAVPGVLLGSRLSSSTSDRVVRPVVIVVLAATGLRLVGVL